MLSLLVSERVLAETGAHRIGSLLSAGHDHSAVLTQMIHRGERKERREGWTNPDNSPRRTQRAQRGMERGVSLKQIRGACPRAELTVPTTTCYSGFLSAFSAFSAVKHLG